MVGDTVPGAAFAGADAAGVLEFWFGERPHAPREVWFRKDPAFDAEIRERFGELIEAALAGRLDHWELAGPESALALLIILDQFTRNAFRDTARMFAGDERALALARRLVESGADRRLSPVQRSFAYLPFEHAESLAEQDRGVALFDELRAYPESAGAYDWAVRHRDVIRRFGRFPHRNEILGRPSTADEVAFLAAPGSRF
jgi:uncharacterized protein (DUF924 family)